MTLRFSPAYCLTNIEGFQFPKCRPDTNEILIPHPDRPTEGWYINMYSSRGTRGLYLVGWEIGTWPSTRPHPKSLTRGKGKSSVRDTVEALTSSRCMQMAIVASIDTPSSQCIALVWQAEAFTQCCFNVGPPSSTLLQHWNNIGWMSFVCCVETSARASCMTQVSLFINRAVCHSEGGKVSLRTTSKICICTQQTRYIKTMLIQCWTSVEDAGPTVKHHCFYVSCLLGRPAGARTQCVGVRIVQRLRRCGVLVSTSGSHHGPRDRKWHWCAGAMLGMATSGVEIYRVPLWTRSEDAGPTLAPHLKHCRVSGVDVFASTMLSKARTQ